MRMFVEPLAVSLYVTPVDFRMSFTTAQCGTHVRALFVFTNRTCNGLMKL
jgi:hypothetical protein